MMSKLKGQIILEFLWIFIFIMGFISSFTYFQQSAEKQIEKQRMGKLISNDKRIPLPH